MADGLITIRYRPYAIRQLLAPLKAKRRNSRAAQAYQSIQIFTPNSSELFEFIRNNYSCELVFLCNAQVVYINLHLNH